MEAIKWGTALTATVCALSAICYFWLTGGYSRHIAEICSDNACRNSRFWFFSYPFGESNWQFKQIYPDESTINRSN
jgi:hypothetical protein